MLLLLCYKTLPLFKDRKVGFFFLKKLWYFFLCLFPERIKESKAWIFTRAVALFSQMIKYPVSRFWFLFSSYILSAARWCFDFAMFPITSLSPIKSINCKLHKRWTMWVLFPFSLSITVGVSQKMFHIYVTILQDMYHNHFCDYILHMICSEKTVSFAGEEHESQALTYPFHDIAALLVTHTHTHKHTYIHCKPIAINHYYLMFSVIVSNLFTMNSRRYKLSGQVNYDHIGKSPLILLYFRLWI